ncbi:hypothetical protein TanjilG_14161 [Lupinus angustifolius]|uniref:Uncharacterized protein n=1 Tax=Lupinus angustifolius TaxID=3871 RepID=A0A1J7GN40_LUPAN|nr:hypothetical protein TanjilG_14161 [Lupinus angustifolius]
MHRSLCHHGHMRNVEVGGSSSTKGGRNFIVDEPYYSPTLQEVSLLKFIGQKHTYILYTDMAWVVEQEFQLHHELEAQGANIFLEWHLNIYPSSVREF